MAKDLDSIVEGNFDDSNLSSLVKKIVLNQASDDERVKFEEEAQRSPELIQSIYQELMRSDEEIQRAIEEQQKQQLQSVQEQQAKIDALRLQQNFSEQGAFSKIRADNEEQLHLANGGKKILHLTDTEVEAEDLEGRLVNLLSSEGAFNSDGSINENVVLVHTGDIGPDLINMQKYRFQAFLPENIAKEGELQGEQREEFISLYKELMDEAGISEELFLKGPKSQQEQQLFQQFNAMLRGFMDPQFKTSEELEEFRKKRERLHSHLEDAILNHSKRNLKEIRGVYDKYGLDESNSVIISGNHDIPYQVQEEFSGMYLAEGETREVGGIKFNRPLGSATGNVYGPSLGRDFMGSNELIEQIPQMRYESQPFQDLKRELEGLGFSNFDDKDIDELIQRSVQKSQMGLTGSYLVDVNKEIEAEVKDEISSRLNRIDSALDKDADVFLGHGDLTHPEHAGLEETYLRRQLNDLGLQGKFYMGGHIHQETTNKTNGMFYINPGSSRDAMAHGVTYIDSQNRILATKSQKINQNMQVDVNYRTRNEIVGSNFEES